jgi:hypothetical protein
MPPPRGARLDRTFFKTFRASRSRYATPSPRQVLIAIRLGYDERSETWNTTKRNGMGP